MNIIIKFTLITLFKVFYITGLAALIPIFFVLFTAEANKTLIIIPFIFIIIGFMGVHWTQKNFGETLKTMGLFTLIPGGIAIIFTFIGKERVLEFIAKYLIGFEKIGPFVERYIQQWVPTLGVFILIYLLLGGILFYLGKKRE